MKNLMKNLWQDEAGIVISTELVFVASIAGIGMIVGLSAARDGVTSELADVAASVSSYNQGYIVDSINGHGASLAASSYNDQLDFCNLAPAPNVDNACLVRVDGTGALESAAAPVPSNP